MSLVDFVRQLPIRYEVDLPSRHRPRNSASEVALISCDALSTGDGCVVTVTRSDDNVYLHQALKVLGTDEVRFMLPQQLAEVRHTLLDLIPPFGSLLGWKTIVDVQAAACPMWRLSCGGYDLLLESRTVIEFEQALVAPVSFDTTDESSQETAWDRHVASQRTDDPVPAGDAFAAPHIGMNPVEMN